MTKQMKLSKNGKLVPTAEQVKLDKVAKTYIKIRDERTRLKKEYDAADAELKAQIDVLDGYLLQTLQSLGVESARTAHGTVYQYIEVKPSCTDWNAFYSWIAENEAFDALERRVKKTFITTYMEDNKNELPPGIKVEKEFAIKVLRS